MTRRDKKRLLAFHDFSEECDDEITLFAASRTAGLRVDVVAVDAALRFDWLRHVLSSAEVDAWRRDEADEHTIVTGHGAHLRLFVGEHSDHTEAVEATLRTRIGGNLAPCGWPIRPLSALSAELDEIPVVYDALLVAAPLRGVTPAHLACVRAKRVVVIGDRGGINCSGYDWPSVEASLRRVAPLLVFVLPVVSRRTRLSVAAAASLPPACCALVWEIVRRFMAERPEAAAMSAALRLRLNSANARMCARWYAESTGSSPPQPLPGTFHAQFGRAIDGYLLRHSTRGLAELNDPALLAELAEAGEVLPDGVSCEAMLADSYTRALRRSVEACVFVFTALAGDDAYACADRSLAELKDPAQAVAKLQRSGLAGCTPCYDLLGLHLALRGTNCFEMRAAEEPADGDTSETLPPLANLVKTVAYAGNAARRSAATEAATALPLLTAAVDPHGNPRCEDATEADYADLEAQLAALLFGRSGGEDSLI
jgi:hypothetical protein